MPLFEWVRHFSCGSQRLPCSADAIPLAIIRQATEFWKWHSRRTPHHLFDGVRISIRRARGVDLFDFNLYIDLGYMCETAVQYKRHAFSGMCVPSVRRSRPHSLARLQPSTHVFRLTCGKPRAHVANPSPNNTHTLTHTALRILLNLSI